jgi:plasmid stabilization system protein ParE
LIAYTREALAQVRALRRHHEALERDTAIRALIRALADAEARIERAPLTGLPTPRPYPHLAQPGRAWIRSGRYWIAYTTADPPVITAVFYNAADIPGRL